MPIDYKEIFSQLPGYWVIKDNSSKYLDANTSFLEQISLDHVAGKTDFDMPWAKSQANKYISDDKKVLHGISLLNYIENQQRSGNICVQVKVNKLPLYKNDHIIGIICHFTDINNFPLATLSKQQHACLKYIVQGCSAKEIARILNLSVRTIETYSEQLKSKLHCNNKAALIRAGMLYFSNSEIER